ncbi:peptidylprolyl isomerase [Hyphococcus sp.]|uniref:peptidylprolyl isomerase n=1 Tax=Hyphococcus sp. TaxID=2038636 RepID=UPI002087C349|nr:MAG: peptidylprolyl isomerase [Marinicaulis sp.]
MLNQVRDSLKGVVAWIFVILLVAAFAMFGVPEMRTFTSGGAVKVGSESFSRTYVQREFDQMYQRSARESGGAFTREAAIASGMPSQAVERIVTQSVLDQYAEKMNLALPREAIRDYLQNNENFQNPATGEFDRLSLENILTNNGMTVKQFESIMREDLTRSQLIESLVSSSPAPKSLMDAMVLRETERRRIAYLTVTDEMAGEAVEPTPEDLQAYYNNNQSLFTAPEYRTFDLLVLRNDDFREGLTVDEAEMRRLYDAGKDRIYTTPEKRTVYQLTYESEAEALAAKAELDGGKPFENLAEAHGMTLEAATFTDAKKSDLLDPSVGDAAFDEDLGIGAVVGPVRSLFGWTIVQIAGITPGETRSYEDVRAEIEASFLENDLRRRLSDAVDQVEEERDTGAELSEAAEAAGFEVTTYGPLDRVSFAPGGAIVDKVPGEAIAEAFNLDEGDQSEALRLSTDDGYFFVSLREITPPALKPFDDVAEDVERRWRDQERRDRIAKTVDAIRTEINSGKAMEAVAETYERAPIELTIDRRFQNETISREFNEKLFFAGLHDVVSSTVGANGAQVVAEIREIGYGRNAISPAEVAELSSRVGLQLDQELIEAFVSSIRDDYGVKINSAQIDALFADGF